jgi:hypothetical protein
MSHYKAEGIVYGNYWGGGRGAYTSKPLEADTKEAIIEKAWRGLKDGSLDGGMGYESLIGALLTIEEIETVTVNAKEYNRSEYDTIYIGDRIKAKEKNFLYQALSY